MSNDDTIAAVSTAPGEGGIGIVRISGKKAAGILGGIFLTPGHEGPGGTAFADRTMYYGHIVEPSSAETVDEVLVVFMKGPRSYTGEDVCEIQCHGGWIPLKKILDIVCSLGAVPAQPGEFTKRAFLNGRIDLVQAGSVIDLVRSKTARGYHAAKEQAEGRLSLQVREIRDVLLGALAEIAVRIDYPEAFEEVDGPVAPGRNSGPEAFEDSDVDGGIGRVLALAEGKIAELLEGADAGRLIRDGVRAVIIGKPNTGKSSLFNALAREDAAIVTATPGTTRDSLEIWLDMLGVPVLLSDTAGIRESVEEIEALGIRRAREQYEKADIAIFLLDGSGPISEEDKAIAKGLNPEKGLIVAINKTDLPQAFGRPEAASILPFEYKCDDVLQISLIGDEASNIKDNLGIIEKSIEGFATGGVAAGSSLLVTKAKHKALLEKAAAEIGEAKGVLMADEAPEFAEVNIRAAWEALGEMIGETATDDIIDRVFEEFCVGK